MADATIAVASVAKTNNTVIQIGVAGAAITAGQALFVDSTANYTLKPSVATVLLSAQVVGIALHAALTGQPIAYATGGDVAMTTLIVGQIYVCSANAGGLAPSADLDLSTGTNYATFIGVSTSAGNLRLGITVSNALNA